MALMRIPEPASVTEANYRTLFRIQVFRRAAGDTGGPLRTQWYHGTYAEIRAFAHNEAQTLDATQDHELWLFVTRAAYPGPIHEGGRSVLFTPVLTYTIPGRITRADPYWSTHPYGTLDEIVFESA